LIEIELIYACYFVRPSALLVSNISYQWSFHVGEALIECFIVDFHAHITISHGFRLLNIHIFPSKDSGSKHFRWIFTGTNQIF